MPRIMFGTCSPTTWRFCRGRHDADHARDLQRAHQPRGDPLRDFQCAHQARGGPDRQGDAGHETTHHRKTRWSISSCTAEKKLADTCTDLSQCRDRISRHRALSRTIQSLEHTDVTVMNRLLAQDVSSMTASLRCDGSPIVGVTDFQTNLELYFAHSCMQCSLTPSSLRRAYPKHVGGVITMCVLSPPSMWSKCVPRHGNTWRSCLQYRGDVVPQVVSTAMVLGRDLPFCPVPCACAPCFLLACTVVITRENIKFATLN